MSSLVQIHMKFDLKGSTVDRAASDKEKVCTAYDTMKYYMYIYELDPYHMV